MPGQSTSEVSETSEVCAAGSDAERGSEGCGVAEKRRAGIAAATDRQRAGTVGIGPHVRSSLLPITCGSPPELARFVLLRSPVSVATKLAAGGGSQGGAIRANPRNQGSGPGARHQPDPLAGGSPRGVPRRAFGATRHRGPLPCAARAVEHASGLRRPGADPPQPQPGALLPGVRRPALNAPRRGLQDHRNHLQRRRPPRRESITPAPTAAPATTG
jgi:hypothetical protein